MSLLKVEKNEQMTKLNDKSLVLSMSNSPYENHIKQSMKKLEETYKHNRILVNTLKMSKKLAYWKVILWHITNLNEIKENKLLPTNFINEIQKLPTSKSFYGFIFLLSILLYLEMQEKYIQMEKLLKQIKIVCLFWILWYLIGM